MSINTEGHACTVPDDVLARTQAVIMKHLKMPKAPMPNQKLVADLGCDSLDVVEIAMALEDAFLLDDVIMESKDAGGYDVATCAACVTAQLAAQDLDRKDA